jgi:putative endonuclease
METKNKETGLLGESMAAKFLEQNGFRVISQNWQYRQWELDLVVQKEDLLVFVEVKTMDRSFDLSPGQKIGKSKYAALGKAADAWLSQHPFEGQIRFDLIYVLLQAFPPEIQHYRDIWYPNNWGR